MAVIPYHHMTEVAAHASSVGDSPDHVRLSRIEVDMEARAPGEAPERRHPSTHRLCGGKQIQHLAETTAGALVMVKEVQARLELLGISSDEGHGSRPAQRTLQMADRLWAAV